MIEKEIRGYIDNAKFDDKLNELVSKFGDFKMKKRFAMVIGDFHNYDTEVRIRITNGEQEMTYKIGDQNALHREEITTKLVCDAENYANLFKSFKSLAVKNFKEPYILGIQHENYLFHTSEFEIKLFKQFNDESHFCGFEVEQTRESEIDIYEFTKILGLDFSEDYNSRESVRERNDKYNIHLLDYPDGKLINLIEKYLDYETQ